MLTTSSGMLGAALIFDAEWNGAGSSPIRWVKPKIDDYGVTTIGFYGGWAVQIDVMLFNDRLILADPHPPEERSYGWCYPKGGAAHLAALAWNPETEAEPAGYTKAARGGRTAGERAPWWHPPIT